MVPVLSQRTSVLSSPVPCTSLVSTHQCLVIPCSLQKHFLCVQGELLSQWEGMRAQLFGTGGATVNGLFNGGPGPGPQRRLRPASTTILRGGSSETVGDFGGVGRSTLQPNRRGLGRKGSGDGSDRGAKGKGGWGARTVLRSPVLGCVAESLAPARSTHEMSNFMPRMQRWV